MAEIAEIFAQTTADDQALDDDATGVELDEDHVVENFKYEVEPDSESDLDHERYEDDGQPLIDEQDEPLLPWAQGVDYTEG